MKSAFVSKGIFYVHCLNSFEQNTYRQYSMSRYWITYISLSIANWQTDSQYPRWFNGYVSIWMRSYSISSNFALRSVSHHRIQSNRQLFAIVKVICITYVCMFQLKVQLSHEQAWKTASMFVRNRYTRITSIAIAIAIAFQHFSLELWTEHRNSNFERRISI